MGRFDELPEEIGVESTEYMTTGGMGELYSAEKVYPHGGRKRLMIKRLLRKHEDVPELVTRFRDEARLGLALHHGNIARVLDYWEIDGQQLLATEFVDGYDLAEIIDASRRSRQPVPEVVAATFVRGIAAALGYMADVKAPDGTALDLVHRDVSPSNVLVSRSGVVKLIDFGVAKGEGRETKTVTGVFVGKYSYMSPEQIQGGDLDIRSDLFALGSLAFELLTGEKAFQGNTDFDTLNLVISTDPVRLEECREGINPLLAEVVQRCLKKNPDERYPHPLELVEDLQRYVFFHAEQPPILLVKGYLRSLEAILEEEGDGRDETLRME